LQLYAVGQHLAGAVDVLQEQVEGGDALGQAALEDAPLGGGDDARDQIVGKDLLGALAAAVDGEGDALVQEREIGGRLALAHLARPHGLEAIEQGLVLRPRLALRVEHLVVGRAEGVGAELRLRGQMGRRHGSRFRGGRHGWRNSPAALPSLSMPSYRQPAPSVAFTLGAGSCSSTA
jgi:hypothetical protein